LDCGSLLPLSARQPAVSGGGWGVIVPRNVNAVGSQQAALPKAAAGCRSPRIRWDCHDFSVLGDGFI
jgi:hypothetical protein